MLLTLHNFIFILFYGGLTLNAALFLLKNVTYVELLKGMFKWSDKDGLMPNPYDLGFISNYASVFGG